MNRTHFLRFASRLLAFTVLAFCASIQAQERSGVATASRGVTAMQAPAHAAGQSYAVVAFHDVADRVQDLDADAITTDRLIAFFDWLKGNGWTPVSLSDIAAAQSGVRELPPKPILLTFDDGYASMYSRVFPLVLAYRYPIVSALVGSWMDVPTGGKVKYGDETVPRERFLTWNRAREMQASGLVEFASHSYNLHEGVPANPQGNTLPSAVALRFEAGSPTETLQALQARVYADLQRSRALMQRELGAAPRALVWPFGRYHVAGMAAAKQAGFAFAMSLEPASANLASPMAIARYWPSHNPTLDDLARNITFPTLLPAAQRLVCVNPAQLWDADPAAFDDQLGRAIERMRVLGATTAVIDAASIDAQGRLQGLWFPSTVLPMRANALSRIAWQMRTRAGVEAVVRLPRAAVETAVETAARQTPELTAKSTPANLTHAANTVFEELGLQLPWDGFFAATDGTARGNLALQADFDRIARGNPELRLIALVQNQEGAPATATFADLTLYPPKRLSGPVPPAIARKVGLWIEDVQSVEARALRSTTIDFSVRGGTAVGWCPDDALADLPAAANVAPAVSAATFPVRF